MTDECEYDNVEHDCTGVAEWRIWADVTMEFHGACPAAVDALTMPRQDWSPSGAASRGTGRINLVMEALR
jgi:hypothetical protein